MYTCSCMIFGFFEYANFDTEPVVLNIGSDF